MQVDETADPSTSHASSGTLTVILHPLVLLNISEHWTRKKLSDNSLSVKVYGSLLGKQEGHQVEILASFELLLDEDTHAVDNAFFTTRESQCKQIYPSLDIIGWYTTGGPIDEQDELFNRQMQDINESLLVLKLDPLGQFGEQMPVRIYESAVDNDAHVQFKLVTYTLGHDEAERIGVDHVARVSSSVPGLSVSLTAEHLLGNYQAIQMLSNRLRLLHAYVAAVAASELPVNRGRLREISALVRRLPLLVAEPERKLAVPSVSDSGDQLCRQANDVCLAALLGNITQGLQTLHACISGTALVIERRSGGALPSSATSSNGGFVRVFHTRENSID